MNILTQLFKSLYSPKDIARLRFQSIGKTITFVFVLTLLSIIPTSIYTSIELYKISSIIDDIVETTLPDFSIENGTLTSSITNPEIYKHNEFTILFDPTGKWSTRQLSKYENSIGLFKNEFGYNFTGSIQSISYSLFNDPMITKQSIVSSIQSFLSFVPIIIALLIGASFIFSSGIKFIEISVFALFGLIFSNLLRKNVPYRRVWILATYSITLAVIFLTLMDLLKITLISSFVVYWVVSLIMLYLVIREVPGKKS